MWSPVTELACLLSVSLVWIELKYRLSFFCMENRLTRYSVTFSQLLSLWRLLHKEESLETTTTEQQQQCFIPQASYFQVPGRNLTGTASAFISHHAEPVWF